MPLPRRRLDWSLVIAIIVITGLAMGTIFGAPAPRWRGRWIYEVLGPVGYQVFFRSVYFLLLIVAIWIVRNQLRLVRAIDAKLIRDSQIESPRLVGKQDETA